MSEYGIQSLGKLLIFQGWGWSADCVIVNVLLFFKGIPHLLVNYRCEAILW